MALTRLEADRDRTILYYPKPAKVPLVVHALRVVVGITLLRVLTSLVVKVGSLSDIGEQVEEQRQSSTSRPAGTWTARSTAAGATASWYVSEINESVYSFTLYRGCAPILATALLMVALSQLPAVKRHCNAFTWKREPDTPSPQGALPPEGQVPPGATPPTAA